MTVATASRSSNVLANGVAALELSRGFIDGLIKDIPADKITSQPVANGNHVLWNLGHLAATDDYFLGVVTGKPSALPKEWESLFGMGSEPKSDAKAYPPLAEVKKAFNERRAALLSWARSQSEEQLASPLPDNLKSFAPTRGALLSALAFHDGVHAGQITVCRKALGLKPSMG